MQTAAILPCYRSSSKAIDVAKRCLDYVDIVICIDDFCPELTGNKIKDYFTSDSRLIVLHHSSNKGVGGAVKTGIRYVINLRVETLGSQDT